MAIVYMAINKVNGKRYIGFTTKKLEKRILGHINAAKCKKRKNNSKFYHAIRKYGIDSFVWETLDVFGSREEGLRAEIDFIARFKPEYNIKPGGQSGPINIPAHNRRGVICLKTGTLFKSVTEAAIYCGGDASDIVKSCKMLGTTVCGRHFMYSDYRIDDGGRLLILDEVKKSQIKKRRRSVDFRCELVVDNSKYKSRSKRVKCLDDGKVFLSASEAGRHYKSAKSAIIELCLGKKGRKTVNGRRFSYVNKES